MGVYKLMLCVLVVILLGCETRPARDSAVRGKDFAFNDLAKGDVDMVTEITIRQSLAYLRELARKLYVRNPNQLLRGGYPSRDHALDRLFDSPNSNGVPGLEGLRAADAISLAFDENFGGDRVGAFVEGMRGMLLDGYGGKQEFYLPDSLDPQILHYLARNFEIAFWKLGHDRDSQQQLFLLSNAFDGDGDLSFERLAGKLIALQDTMAQVVADSSNRRIKNVIQGVASAVFFPI